SGGVAAGMVRVSLVSTYGKLFVLPRLSAFLERYPDITLQIHFHDGDVNLIDDNLDVALCFDSPRGASYVSRVICRSELNVVASPGYLAQAGPVRTPDALLRRRMLAAGGPAFARKPWRFTPKGGGESQTIHVPPSLIFEEMEGAVTAALNGLG